MWDSETRDKVRSVGKVNSVYEHTSIEITDRKKEIEKMIQKKSERSTSEYHMKSEVLKNNFSTHLNSLVQRIQKQKAVITSGYGPVVLSKKKGERPIYEIPRDLDPVGHKWMKQLVETEARAPTTLLVKIRSARCIKDKIASGHFLVVCHVLDRLGGNRIFFDTHTTESTYKLLSRNLRDFAKKKRAFLNAENRQMEATDEKGEQIMVKATATGQGFFNPQSVKDEDERKERIDNSQMETSAAVEQ